MKLRDQVVPPLVERLSANDQLLVCDVPCPPWMISVGSFGCAMMLPPWLSQASICVQTAPPSVLPKSLAPPQPEPSSA